MPYLNSMFGFSYGYILAPTQNPAQHLEKICEKVAETAEIPKTAPKTQLKIMCTQCQGHLVFYFPNIWTLSFMEFQDSYNEFCRIKKFVQ